VRPDHSRYDWGECSTPSLAEGEDVQACFKGQMWNGDPCCAYDVVGGNVEGAEHWPDFT
jgi:hypothetical protein